MMNINKNIHNQPPPPVNAEASVTISANTLEASITINPPKNGGADLSFPMLKIFLAKNRVVSGIDDDVLKSLAENPVYNTGFVIARGTTSIPGKDAEIIYYIETNRTIKPKEKEDGSVDFKDLGMIQAVQKGQLLCEKMPLIPGINGTDVRGRAILAVSGKDKNLPEGNNTIASDDKLKLFAAVDGHVTVIGGKINVLNTFVVKENVSVETGNIDFSGNVIVRGDVAQGYSVKAAGDVTVDGVVEAANITVGGDLLIRGGFIGGESGVLDVNGNAVCRFIEGGQAIIKGDLETTYIMNSKIKCGGAVNLTGKGLIRGGYVSARTSVTANVLGSPKGASAGTIIEIGNDSFLSEQYKKLSAESAEHEKNITSLEALVRPLERAKQAGYLTPEKVKQLERATVLLENLKPEYNDIQDALEVLKKRIDAIGRGSVNVRKTAYTGTKIVIGTEMLILQTEHDRVSFYNSKDGITFIPYSN